jgi:hypothetical protein
MSKPMPLTVCGPVTPISPFVRVTGVLPTAEVSVLDNGQSIGQATAANPGELLVPLTTQPALGHSINAVQKTAMGTSQMSVHPIMVVDVPDPLPVPVILSALNTCMSDILADGLVPGARVITSIGGQPFGSYVASQTTAWLGIDSKRRIMPNSQVDIHQEAQVGATTRASKSAPILNTPDFQIATDLLPPPVLGPLVECNTSRDFQHAIPGAATTITNEGQSEFWINPSAAFNGYGALPLRTGKAEATQAMPRCGRRGQSITIPVTPAATPPAPTSTQDLCPQTLRLTVSNLAPGGILHVTRQVQIDPAGTSWTLTPIGDHGVGYPSEPVDLPPDIVLTDPAGPVFISLTQERCGAISPQTLVKVAPVGGPFGAPTIVEPLVDCSGGIPIKGAHPAAIVQAIDASSRIPLSDPTSVTQAEFVMRPWFPLAAGTKILIRQQGCNADGDSHVVKVQPLPQPLAVPKIVEPVRPQAAWVKVAGVVPGARLYLLVNNQLRPGSVYVYSDVGIIPITGAVLAEKDTLFVIQALCDKSSSPEGLGVTVKRGNLKVNAPQQVTRGSTAQVIVTALDADTGMPVSAEVLLNNLHVGMTGVAFSYSPKVGDPNPAGIVRSSVAYFDANFTINLVDAAWTLTLHAGPIPARLDTISIDITQLSWKVTPDWNPGLAKTVTVTPAPPTGSASLTVPVPTSAVKTVTVEISGSASTKGGVLNGYQVAAQSGAVTADTQKVAFHGSDELAAWLLRVDFYGDPTTGDYTFSVVPTLQGISP